MHRSSRLQLNWDLRLHWICNHFGMLVHAFLFLLWALSRIATHEILMDHRVGFGSVTYYVVLIHRKHGMSCCDWVASSCGWQRHTGRAHLRAVGLMDPLGLRCFVRTCQPPAGADGLLIPADSMQVKPLVQFRRWRPVTEWRRTHVRRWSWWWCQVMRWWSSVSGSKSSVDLLF